MTSSNSPSAPYLRHNREAHHESSEGWTGTLTKIANPKSRHWCACSTGWIVISLLFLSSALWMGGFHHKGSDLSNNSFSWNKYLAGSVTTSRPISAVHNDQEVKPKDSCISSERPAPITHQSRETIMAIGLTLPGSDPSNIKGDKPAPYPAPTIVPVVLRERERKASKETNSGPAQSSETSLGTEPADSSKVVDCEVIDPALDNNTCNETSFAPDPR